MYGHAGVVLTGVALALGCLDSVAAHTEHSQAEPIATATARAAPILRAQPTLSQDSSGVRFTRSRANLPCEAFTKPPEKPHDPTAHFFAFDQLEHTYRVPGEFAYRLNGDQYGFETLSFIITETHPGGGPGLHVHDTEEAHILLKGSAQYQIGDKTFTVKAPYVARVPAGVPHTFINVGAEPFNLVAVFASKNASTTRVGPNPLVPLWQSRNGSPPCRSP